MNFESFNILGYLSVLLWLGVPVLWFLHSKIKPRKWFCHFALVVSVLALAFASVNSHFHVNKLQLDTSEQLAALEAERQAKRQAALDSRSGDVADIRFAEDGADDYYDKAGMDETELKYLDSIDNSGDPAWKKKKQRSESSGDADDLESQIGAVEEQESVNSEALEGVTEEEPIMMTADQLKVANMLDAANMNLARIIFYIAILLVIVDYLRRANVYEEAYLPLPLPSAWLNYYTQAPALLHKPKSSKTRAIDELKRITQRGDSFLYVTDDDMKAAAVPDQLRPLLGKFLYKDVLKFDDPNYTISNEFAFEALWYNRCSFVVNSPVRAQSIIYEFIKRLKERRLTRSKVRQTCHVVWDASQPLAEPLHDEFVRLAAASGISLFILSPILPATEETHEPESL